ncbi:MAG: hypothetical protein IIA67_02000, partial [Planctomycetes bacterium]|nr:hypothetical protein [Planctomycetota bacterium]
MVLRTSFVIRHSKFVIYGAGLNILAMFHYRWDNPRANDNTTDLPMGIFRRSKSIDPPAADENIAAAAPPEAPAKKGFFARLK